MVAPIRIYRCVLFWLFFLLGLHRYLFEAIAGLCYIRHISLVVDERVYHIETPLYTYKQSLLDQTHKTVFDTAFGVIILSLFSPPFIFALGDMQS